MIIENFDFDLDLPAAVRWEIIFDTYRLHLSRISKKIRIILADLAIVPILMQKIDTIDCSKIPYYDELCYISKRFFLSIVEILLLQLVYETLNKGTVAIVTVGSESFFLKTIDSELAFLKEITIGLNIKKDSKTIGKSTTWLGYLGFLTATNILNDYTITANHTKCDFLLMIYNFDKLVLKQQFGFLLRSIIENTTSLTDAKDILQTTELADNYDIVIYVPNNKSFTIKKEFLMKELICAGQSAKLYLQLVQSTIDQIANHTDINTESILKLLLRNPIYDSNKTICLHYQFKGHSETLVNNTSKD